MNSLYGTIRLISEDALYFFYKIMILYVVLPLVTVWILLELVFGATIGGISISGTAYFFIVFFAAGSHLTIYKVAIGLGSTRVQLLKVYYGIGISAVLISMLILNVLQLILRFFFTQFDLAIQIMHPWENFFGSYQFFSLLGMDLLLGIFLFGLTFLLYSIYFRLGTRRISILFTSLLIIGMVFYYGGFIGDGVEWVMGLNIETIKWLVIALLSIGGIGSLALSYPIMQNASMQLKTRKD